MIKAEKKRSMTKIETHTAGQSRNNIETMNRWIDLRADEDNCDKNPKTHEKPTKEKSRL